MESDYVDNTMLTASSPLNGYSKAFNDTLVREISTLAIVSIAVPRNGLDALNERLASFSAVSFPQTGQCIRTSDVVLADTPTALVVYGLQSDQCFVVAELNGVSTQDFFELLCAELGPAAYLTDQSDSWAVLDVEGSLVNQAMERLCMLDLTTFTASDVARTTMEHLSVIIEKPADDRVRLYSPRSSARSFLHAITTSILNVVDD